MDRISNLPDCCLYHILSCLSIKDAIGTSLLSKRWRYVWKSMPVIEFNWQNSDGTSRLSKFIDHFLLRYAGPKILKCTFSLLHANNHRLDAWLHVAMRHKVEDLDLGVPEFEWVSYTDDPSVYYVVPSCLFRCEYLKKLNLCCGEIKPPSSFNFRYLKEINLCRMQLPDFDTSGCPLLETLVITECNFECSLNIHAPNQRLKYITIDENMFVPNHDTKLAIYAPHVLCVSFLGCLRRSYDLRNFDSVMSARLSFYEYLEDQYPRWLYKYPDDLNPGRNVYSDALTLVQLMKSLLLAKQFQLCQWCIQALAYIEAQGLGNPQLNATHLVLGASLTEFELLGLISILRNCCNLESLIINVCKEYQVGCNVQADDLVKDALKLLPDFHFDEDTFVELLKHALSAQSNLKMVKIREFLGSRYIPYACDPTVDINKIFEDTEREIKLVELFLQCCNKLDMMTINTTKKLVTTHNFGGRMKELDLRAWPLRPDLLRYLTKKLLAFPKASANAELYVS